MSTTAQVQRRFSGSALLFLAPVLLLLAFSAQDILDSDTWWHLKTGEIIASSHQIPRTDPFSEVNFGKAWVNFEWLSQLIFYLVYRLAGPGSLVLGKTLIIGFCFLLFSLTGLELKRPLLGSSLLTLSVIAASERYLDRPEIFSYLLLGAFIFILHRYRHGQCSRAIFLLPVLQALWENLHGGTWLGIVTVGAYVAGQSLLRFLPWPSAWKQPAMDAPRFRRLLLAAALVVPAAMINPWGPKTLAIIFQTQAHQWTMANISEWQRTYELARPWSPAILAYWAWVGLAGLGFLLNFRRVDLNHLFLALGFLLISLLALRNVALFALVALPVTARNFSLAAEAYPWRKRRPWLRLNRILPPVRAVAAAGLAFFCLGFSRQVITDRYYLGIHTVTRFGWDLSALVYPWPMLDFLKQSGIQGPIFNDHDLGGFLIWRNWPTSRVFLDSRAFIYDPEFMTAYSRALNDAAAWKELADRYQFRLAVILHTEAGIGRLPKILARNPDWTPVYLDETGVIFARNLPENAAWIARHRLDLGSARSLTFTAPSRNQARPRLWLFTAAADPLQAMDAALFFKGIDQYDAAEPLYRQALQIDPSSPTILTELAALEVLRHRPAEAETYARRAIARNPHLVDAWLHLGDAFYNQARFSESVWAFSEGLRREPGRRGALENRGAALAQLGRYPEAAADLEQAISLKPTSPRPWCNLAYVYDAIHSPRATDTWKQCLAGLIGAGSPQDEIRQAQARLGQETP
jgi:tetratricopeptide (TPR) repeat protein